MYGSGGWVPPVAAGAPKQLLTHPAILSVNGLQERTFQILSLNQGRRAVLRTLFSTFAITVLFGAASAARAVPIYDFSPVTAEMQAFVQTRQLDGASLRVNKAGNVVYRRALGGYTIGNRIRIASASKWLSALTIARVVEKGQMRWTDTVGQYFPTVDSSKRPITPRISRQ